MTKKQRKDIMGLYTKRQVEKQSCSYREKKNIVGYKANKTTSNHCKCRKRERNES